MEPETAEQIMESIRRWAAGAGDLSPAAADIVGPLGDSIRAAALAGRDAALASVNAVLATMPEEQRAAMQAACLAQRWCESHLRILFGKEGEG